MNSESKDILRIYENEKVLTNLKLDPKKNQQEIKNILERYKFHLIEISSSKQYLQDASGL
jgi:hypothetical protein